MNKDTITAILKRAVDILFVLNSRGTSIGALTGVCGDGLLKLFTPALEAYRETINITQLKIYHLIATGIVLFNIPSLFRTRELPKEIEDAFETLNRIKDQVSREHLKMQYLGLVSEVVTRVQIQPKKVGRRSKTSSSPSTGGRSANV